MVTVFGWVLAALVMLVLLISGCSAVGMGEPQIVGVATPRPTFAPREGSSAENPAFTGEGAALFATHCTSCHGPEGHGDGASVRSGTIAYIPDFHRPDTMTVRTVDDIYAVISDGRLEKLMPPWKDILSEQQRQALAAFIYGLGHQ